MKIIIPMAGRGSRFTSTGINLPKPLIDISGKLMIEWALKNISGLNYSELIFIILKEHDVNFELSKKLLSFNIPKVKILIINDVTQGQLQTVLSAKESIQTEEDILISPTDTYVISNINHTIENRDSNCAGIISVINKEGNQWSFAKIDKFNTVTDVAEKQRISSLASTGIYYFSNGCQFVKEAERIITLNEKTQGEFYIIPVYQKLINNGHIINIDKAKAMWDLGTPESINLFERYLSSMEKP
tara:strand:- start:4623 stop:5354 length:732 start_codon:yes stop_codon:yes gene_type:complete